MEWFRYVWVGMLILPFVVMYLWFTYVAFKDLFLVWKTRKEDFQRYGELIMCWIAIHIIVIFILSLVYFCI